MDNKSIFRRDIDFNLQQSVTVHNGGCHCTGGGISVYCYHDGFLYLSGLGVPSGHFKRAKVDGDFDRLSFYDCDVPESVWEIVDHEDVPGVVVKKLVDYVMWAVLGWS